MLGGDIVEGCGNVPEPKFYSSDTKRLNKFGIRGNKGFEILSGF